MNWEWQVFCQDTITQEVGQSCFGKNGDVTYLDWMLSAWGRPGAGRCPSRCCR